MSNNTVLLCMWLYKWKELNSLLLLLLFSSIQILRGQTLIFLQPSVFIPDRLWFFRRFYWQNVFPQRLPFQNSLINGLKGIMRRFGEIDLFFQSKTKNSFSGIDISQPTPSMKLWDLVNFKYLRSNEDISLSTWFQYCKPLIFPFRVEFLVSKLSLIGVSDWIKI